jgi:hypothetical protein
MADGQVVPADAHAGECDVIVGQRICNEGSSITSKKLAKAGRTKLVFETDDLVSEVAPSNRCRNAAQLAFTAEDVLDRVDELGDLLANLDNTRVAPPEA